MNTSPVCPSCGKPLAPDAPKGLCQECLFQAGFPSGTQTEPSSSQPSGFVPPSPEELASKFPQLEILELLGRGGMGAVYKARQKRLGRIVALKILPPSIGKDPAFAERFTREAQALANLNHPGIVTLYEFGETDGLFFFLMEFVDGANLGQLLHTGRVAPREALAIVPQICDALQYAHDQGIVHRDIKPENILIDRRGRVKVADFGVARLIRPGEGTSSPMTAAGGESSVASAASHNVLTEVGKVMGTPQYMAPEQFERPAHVDHRADIYALGVVFYQMLTGELPAKRIEPPSKKVQIDVRLDDVVLRALEQKPEMRYQTASDLKTQVETVAMTGPPPPGAGNSTYSQRLSRKALWGALWAPALFVASILFFTASAVPRTSSGSPTFQPAIWLVLLMFAVAGVGFTAPFGTTILGCVAIGEIRRSAGRLYGLKLALADALFFPLFTLNAALVFLTDVVHEPLRRTLVPDMDSGLFVILLMTATVILCLLLDFFIIRAAWRAVSRPLGATAPPILRKSPWAVGVKIALAALLLFIAAALGSLYWQNRGVPIEDISRVPEIEKHLAQEIATHLERANFNAESIAVLLSPPRYARAECLIDGLIKYDGPRPTDPTAQRVYVATHGGGLLRHKGNGLWTFIGHGALQQMRFHLNAGSEAPPGAHRFGPVIENVVTDLIDLDSGELADLPLPQPVGERDAARYDWINGNGKRWAREHGFDAINANHALINVNLTLIQLHERDWESLTPRQLQAKLDAQSLAATGFGDMRVTTYGFKTPDGAIGLLQMMNDRVPRGVKIRYKLVQKQ
jgi:serine/threonine protein kinase